MIRATVRSVYESEKKGEDGKVAREHWADLELDGGGSEGRRFSVPLELFRRTIIRDDQYTRPSASRSPSSCSRAGRGEGAGDARLT